jgi:nitrite reductase/ring-hydroxylating ferredoxin subunit
MNNSRLDAGSINEIKPGKMKRVDAGNGKRILICHVDGEFYAVDDMCTHEDSSLYLGCLHGDRVHCSLHGAEFSVKTGAPMAEPAEIPLKTYPVSIEDGRIWVTV